MSARAKRPTNRWGCKPEKQFCYEHNLPTIGGKYWCPKSSRNYGVIHIGDVFTKANEHRRVIHVQDGRICYSNGGNINHWCNTDTFELWVIGGAKLIKDGEHVEAL